MRYLCLLLVLLLPLPAAAAKPAGSMVVAAHPQAVAAGIDMLNKGGNAFDAAAAVALALGVVEPGSSGFGGGGFFLLYIAKTDRYVMIDARETAPALAGHGEVYATASSIDGPQSAGVPGLPAGVERLVSSYGQLPRSDVTAPAIRLAREGFAVTPHLGAMIRWRAEAFNDSGRAIFMRRQGETIRQPALADTLARFAVKGAADFYRGETAGRLVADMQRDGGLIRLADLAAYHVIEREPVSFDFHGFHVVSAALPSSGGMTLAHIFAQLQDDDLAALSRADRTHLLIETMKRAYRDRNACLGDSDFVSIPKDYLDAQRLQALRASIQMDQTTPSAELAGFAEPIGASVDTTHFSIIDAEGNMVSATLSINYGFGSGYVSPSTGILLNDEMDDFATRPGQPNAYGLVQGRANAVAPGKRMLSSMTPTFVVGPDRTFIVGTPGGSRIISMVLLAAVGFMLDETPPADWVNRGRFHHQFLPDLVQYEPDAFSPPLAAGLEKRGHLLKQMNRQYGNMQAILWDRRSGRLTGIADRRGDGAARQP
ncbi:MAG: gamma-glutamyltransferase [Zetaproteobacteria bacterium CG12_big_fil_rev_8_21_14_0_65_54_13]|nr:MAG: gamma-glutamyltransferase [Zetaproteobacteria bacterium CG12_big_fil_rev_8_21_14_0_65_54_13]PIX54207.1 MAG: gamma-glutamyltransferase [Zetaproteobacteria bacterium CG_4_10_14_3_um_filter_54_28]PJA29064.1 MAG: gamma-glutamyltransferase [Zetaproteobacteria bacterium CG_4_9_14_3_um_filter_54_145]